MSSFKDNSGLEEFKPKASQAERDEQMKKFLAKGGKIQKLEPGYPINVGSLDKSRKPGWTKEDIKEGKKGKTAMPDYKTYKKGLRAIDSIAVSSGVMSYIEGSKLVEYSDAVESNHRGYIADVAMEDYFETEFSQWDSIDRVMLNPSKRSHREKFVEEIEYQLQMHNIEF